jgi:hypothetical protein
MVLNRDAIDSGTSNLSYGIDANIRLFGNMVVNSYYAASNVAGDSADGDAARLSVAYRSAFWNTSAMWKRVSDDFNPSLGFVRRKAMEQWFGTVGMHFRPRSRRFQEIVTYVDGEYIANPSSQLETRTLTVGTDVFFQPDGSVTFEANDTFDRLESGFDIFPGVNVPAGGYDLRDATVRYTSGQAKPLYGSASVSAGEFYGGTRRTYGGSFTWRVRYYLSLEGALQRNDVDLPGGSFLADIASARLRYAWSTRLFGSAFVQYNTQSRSLVTNGRINFRYAPLSDVFLVYTERRNRDLGTLNERSVALKLTRLFAF